MFGERVEYPGNEILFRMPDDPRTQESDWWIQSLPCPTMERPGLALLYLLISTSMVELYLSRSRSAACKSKVTPSSWNIPPGPGGCLPPCAGHVDAWCLASSFPPPPPIAETGPLCQIGHLTLHPEYWYVRPSLCRNSQVPRGRPGHTCGGSGLDGLARVLYLDPLLKYIMPSPGDPRTTEEGGGEEPRRAWVRREG